MSGSLKKINRAEFGICHGTDSWFNTDDRPCISESTILKYTNQAERFLACIHTYNRACVCTHVLSQITNERDLRQCVNPLATGYTSQAISNRLNPSWLYAWELGNRTILTVSATPVRHEWNIDRRAGLRVCDTIVRLALHVQKRISARTAVIGPGETLYTSVNP